MRRNNKKEKPFLRHVQYLVIGLFVIFVVFVLLRKTVMAIKNSGMFVINEVVADQSVSFISSPYLTRLKGENIFDVDLKGIQNKLAHQYPQLSQVSVIKQFPNKILVKGKKRNIFAQVAIRNRWVTIDADGVALFESAEMDNRVPLIKGIKMKDPHVYIGYALPGEQLKVAVRIIKAFKSNGGFFDFPLLWVDVGNLSKISLSLFGNLEVIVDRYKIVQKLSTLELLLSQKKINFEEVRYIDLRFNEPVLRKK
ncbi:MAG: FtsQ-type POTRA domain-containing protein [Candidatus Omnitrophota bacterium]